MNRLLTIVIAASSLAACAFLPERPDPICHEVAVFANSVPNGEKRSVRLDTAWGSGLEGRDDDDVLFEKRCDHAGHELAEPLCRYLIEQTSAEFMSANVSRILGCFPGAPPFRQVAEVSVHELAGVISTWSFPGVREDIEVIIGFSTGCPGRDPHLEITADRLGDYE